ncbi:MAG: methyl-accepting chemotaxis protein [Alphaproteobacteria bacterium]|nr:methyl-accepting chemotaxis protein [Alphaproteobacteria bacterium]
MTLRDGKPSGSLRTRLLVAFSAVSALTLIACAYAGILTNDLARLLQNTVQRDVRLFSTATHGQELTGGLTDLTARYLSAARSADLASARAALVDLEADMKKGLAELSADPGLADAAERAGTSFAEAVAGLRALEAVSARRIEAVERRSELAATVLPLRDRLNSLIVPRIDDHGFATIAAIDRLPSGSAPLSSESPRLVTATLDFYQMLQFRVDATLVGSLLADAGALPSVDLAGPLRERFTAAVGSMRRFLPAIAKTGDMAQIEAAVTALIAVGTGQNSLFDLRVRELQAIVEETRLAAPARERIAAAATASTEVVDALNTRMSASVERAAQDLGVSRSILVSLAVASLAVSLLLGWVFIGRGIADRVRGLTAAMTSLAAGNRDVEIPAPSDDEIGQMTLALEVFKEQAIKSAQLTEDVTRNVRVVASAASQVSGAVSHVTEGSQSQLEALQSLSRGLAQSASAVAEVSSSAQVASDQARHATGLVSSGLERMAGLETTVRSIADTAKRIAGMADSIRTIATQTNMLSLNAAIEAARAGEHGRGFAVVAEEVRKLAEGSGKLAAEISDVVMSATTAADQGVAVASDVSGDIRRIADTVTATNKLIATIATAIEEQAHTAKDSETTVQHLARIGQANVTAAEQITASMIDLSRTAERTRQLVEAFDQVRLQRA